MRGCALAICGVILGLVVSIGIAYYYNHAYPGEEAVRAPLQNGQEQSAYLSFQIYAERTLNMPRSTFPPYQAGVAIYEGSYIWHFRFSVNVNGGAIPVDVRYRSLPGDQWEKVSE